MANSRELEDQTTPTKGKIIILDQMLEKKKGNANKGPYRQIKQLAMEFEAAAEMIGKVIGENKG